MVTWAGRRGSSCGYGRTSAEGAGRRAQELEEAADQLLRALPKDPERVVLSARQEQCRRRRECVIREDDLVSPWEGEPGDERLAAARQRLREADLTGEERASFLLFITHLWSYQEIADLFGFTRRTAWNRVAAAVRKLAARGGTPGGTEPG